MEGHKQKRKYYVKNNELVETVASLFQVASANVEVLTITLSWREVWAGESIETLSRMSESNNAWHYNEGSEGFIHELQKVQPNYISL